MGRSLHRVGEQFNHTSFQLKCVMFYVLRLYIYEVCVYLYQRWCVKTESLNILGSITTRTPQHRVFRDITELFLSPTCTERHTERESYLVGIHNWNSLNGVTSHSVLNLTLIHDFLTTSNKVKVFQTAWLKTASSDTMLVLIRSMRRSLWPYINKSHLLQGCNKIHSTKTLKIK